MSSSGLFGYGAVSAVPTVEYLADTKLMKLEEGKDASAQLMARDLFRASPILVMAVRRPGCSLCRKQAAQLCALNEQLAKKGVRVIGVVHESRGVDEFRPFLGCADAIYLDAEKRFFDPEKRWLPAWMGFLRLNTYTNLYKAKKAGFAGNLEGEGRLLGGVYLIDKDKMLFAHLEQSWGDEAEAKDLLAALDQIHCK